jgi:hypothetical protein
VQVLPDPQRPDRDRALGRRIQRAEHEREGRLKRGAVMAVGMIAIIGTPFLLRRTQDFNWIVLAPLAQWQSNGLLIRGLGGSIPPGRTQDFN